MLAETSDEKDKRLFKELNNHSTALRASAEKFADFLMQLKNQTSEIKALIKSLDHISVSPIEIMDECIMDLTKRLMSLNTKLGYPNALTTVMEEKQFIEFNKLSEETGMSAALLTQKAIELSEQNEEDV